MTSVAVAQQPGCGPVIYYLPPVCVPQARPGQQPPFVTYSKRGFVSYIDTDLYYRLATDLTVRVSVSTIHLSHPLWVTNNYPSGDWRAFNCQDLTVLLTVDGAFKIHSQLAGVFLFPFTFTGT